MLFYPSTFLGIGGTELHLYTSYRPLMKTILFILTLCLFGCGSLGENPFDNKEIIAISYLHAMDTHAAQSVSLDSLNMHAIDTARKVTCDLNSLHPLLVTLTTNFNPDSTQYFGTSLLEIDLESGQSLYAAYYPEVGIFRFYENGSFGVRYSVPDSTRKELIEKMNTCGSYLLRWNQKERIKKQSITKNLGRLKTHKATY